MKNTDKILAILKELKKLQAFYLWKRNQISFRYFFAIFKIKLRNQILQNWNTTNGAYIQLEKERYFFIPKELDLHGYTVLTKGLNDNYLARFLIRYSQPGTVVIDIGANIGELALPFAEAVGSRGLMLAFEPIPFLANAISKTMLINNITWAEVVNCALDNTESIKHLEIQYSKTNIVDSGGSRLSNKASKKTIPIKTTTLDSWTLKNIPNNKKVSLIKIDVEGYELPVLQGARRLLSKHKPVLVLEIGHENAMQRKKIASLLKSMDYQPTAVIFRAGLLPLTWDELTTLSGPLKKGYTYDVILQTQNSLLN